ncbi:hypothetical protein BH10ACT11_BH10ACT11_02370 [soil metagenome]
MNRTPQETERIYMGAMFAFGGFIVLIFGPTLFGALMLIFGLAVIGIAMNSSRDDGRGFRGDRDYEDPYEY